MTLRDITTDTGNEEKSIKDKTVGKKIAIIGTGISGMSAAWLLAENHDVTIFDSKDYIGGHSHTVDVTVDGKTFPVDTGFIVFNPQNYPNLIELFKTLDVPTYDTDMSFSVSLKDEDFEYSGGDGWGMLAQPSNIFKPRFWSLVRGILKFYKKTEAYIDDETTEHLTLGELLKREGYSKSFVQDHLAPMGAAIWSSDSADILDYPARSFLRFFKNHGLTQLTDRPAWRTVRGGSREYVKRITAKFKDRINLSTPVSSVRKVGTGVEITAGDRAPERFDEVVFACHSDQALAMLADPTDKQLTVLSDLKYRPNHVVWHTDVSVMPKRKAAWASWNYSEKSNAGENEAAVSYWMNKLQPLPTETPVIVTLGPNQDIDPAKILGEYTYSHPVFDMAALKAKQDIWALQGDAGMWFCGAYLGDGFHEDGIQSGLAVAEMLGGMRRPWQKPEQNARIGLCDLVSTGNHEEVAA